MPLTHGELKLKARYRLAKQLQAKNHYDQAIVLPNSFKSALIRGLHTFLCGRVGSEYRYGVLNDVRRSLHKATIPTNGRSNLLPLGFTCR